MRRQLKRLFAAATNLQQLRRWRWLLPLGLMFLVVLYEIGPSRWIYAHFGFTYHLAAEILIFGTIGPALVFLTLNFVNRWLEERETSDLQAQLLIKTQRDANHSRQLIDDAVQILFAVGTLIDSLKSSHTKLPGETAIQVEAMEQSLHNAIEQLRRHLLNESLTERAHQYLLDEQ